MVLRLLLVQPPPSFRPARVG